MLFNYKNIQINYTTTGKGSVIVLLHGFLESLTMWNEIVSELLKRNRVITIDLLGHGKTENLGYMHTMDDQARMVKSLLSNLKLRKFTLIGHSMGGYIALAFADLFPNSVKGICLMNSTAYADSEEKKTNRDRAIKAVKQNYKTFVRISIPKLFSEENRESLKSEIKNVTLEALKTSKQSIIASLEGMKIRTDKTHVLQNNNIHKLLILGENDSALNIEIHKKQIEGNATNFVQLTQGHMSHIENKSELIFYLKKFITLK